jgi:hypothetical protein
MNMDQTEQQSLQVSQEQLLTLVRTLISGSRGREDEEHPLPPGPWDPIIRVALERLSVFGPQPEPWRVFGQDAALRRAEAVFGPRPEPWQVVFASILTRHPEIWDALGGGHSFGEEVALNPQPLPPRFALLTSVAQAVISRAELLQEIADATRREGEEQGIIIVSGYLARFVDDFCGTEFRPKWLFPGPPPPWFADELKGIDLVVMATQFEQAAREAYSPELRQNLADANARLVEAGLAKLQ